VLVIAQSSRVAGRANQLTGLRVDTTAQLWHYDCAGRDPLAVRFAAVPTGDRPELGRLTKAERTPTVVVRCAGRDLRFDPAVGPPR
jgi:hypothetical protein